MSAQIEGAARRGRKVVDDAAPVSFAEIVAAFKRDQPDAWQECRTWPTESGVVFIAEKLKG